jgi:hypothetical protein
LQQDSLSHVNPLMSSNPSTLWSVIYQMAAK